jgi:hypothetical protein
LVNRLTQLPERPVRPPIRPQLSGRQRDQLVGEFLESRHGVALTDDAADIARLWIDHAVDRTVGGPLRVSAVLVELFLSYWLPRKVLADSTYFAAVPVVVKAWLAFAGERTELDLDTIEEALDAVDVWTPALEAAALSDPIGSKSGERVFLDDTTADLEDAYRTLAGLGAPPRPDLAAEAYEIADRLVRDAPELLAKARLSTWPRAIVWLLAHRHRLVGPGEPLTPHGLASELSSSPPTLRKTAKFLTDTLILPR